MLTRAVACTWRGRAILGRGVLKADSTILARARKAVLGARRVLVRARARRFVAMPRILVAGVQRQACAHEATCCRRARRVMRITHPGVGAQGA